MNSRHHLLRAAAAVPALLCILVASLLWGCNESADSDQDKAKTKTSPEVALAKSTDDSSGPVSLDELLADQSVTMGMGKAALVEALGRHPGRELIEITLHNRDLTLLLAPAGTAQSSGAPRSKTGFAPMLFLLRADRLALAVEICNDKGKALQAMDVGGLKTYGESSSFPPRGLREWAAGNEYFDSDKLSMYLNVEDAVARNIWHESNVNASFRLTKSKGDHFWFMLSPKHKESDAVIPAIYGVIDPQGLPDNLQESGKELESVLQGFGNTLQSNLHALGFSSRYYY